MIDETCWVFAILGNNQSIIDMIGSEVNLSEFPDIHRNCAIEVIRSHGNLKFLRSILDEREFKEGEERKEFDYSLQYLDPLLVAAVESHNFSYLSQNFHLFEKKS